ncbi:MAG TPA: peptide MFS transporter [Caulobacteraceae bacterium]|jgi:POT family proton-dependent oligopeptide transporter
MTTIVATDFPATPRRTIFGHPRGLAVLALTELWDRISFHGMQAVLVLFMVDQLLRPGHIEHIVGFAPFRAVVEQVTGPLSVQALASQIFGLYVGLVAATPMLGGYLGDRVLGRTRTVTLGALLMTIGHFCMAFDQSFLLALTLLILGAGFLRANLSPQISDLYPPDDRRREVAFQLYASMINLGGFIAPLATGALAQAWSWHAAFGFAGFGMLIGLIVYLAGRRDLPATSARPPRGERARLTIAERKVVGLLLLLVPVASLFWIAQSQVWNTYNLWARDHIDLNIGGWTMPVVWLQSLDGLAPFVLLPPTLVFWRWQADRGVEPGSFTKLAIGCLIFAVSTAWLAAAGLVTDGSGRTPLLWAVAFHGGSNLGWLYFAPSATALFTRCAPRSVNGLMIGTLSLSVTLGSLISGRIGGLYETLDPSTFWLLHAALVGAGGALFFIIGKGMGRRFYAAAPPALAACP